MFLPREHGGSGSSLTALTAVAEAVAAGCATTAAIISTYQLGAFPILLEGTAGQKSKYLGELARGNSISFALSEQGSGSEFHQQDREEKGRQNGPHFAHRGCKA